MHEGSRQRDPRRAHRQPRDRDRQGRRRRDHRLGVDARRVHPLVRRHRQPGLAVPRGSPSPATRRRAPSVRVRRRAVLLGVRRRPGAVHPRRAVLAVRGHPEAHPSPRAREPGGRVRRARPRHRARGVLAAHRDARRESASQRGRPGSSSSAARRTPSCRSCCSRTSARSPVSSSHSSGLALAVGTDEPRFDAIGSIAIGTAARRDRGRAGGRDEEPAHRRERAGGIVDATIEAMLDVGPEVRSPHPPAHAATRTGGAAGRRQARLPRDRAPPSSRRRSTRSRAGCVPRYPRSD